jgi:hypothetical protein
MKKMTTTIVALAMMVGGVAAVGAMNASATTVSVPTITISPNLGLTSNQKVTITGSGFTANESSLVAVECNGAATTEAGCDIAAPAPLTVDANGNIAASTYVVTTGTIGNGTCGTSATDSTCIISIGSIATGKLVTFATFSFASGPGLSVSPSTGLANGQAVTLSGSGFTSSDSLYAVECLATATTPAGCDTSTATPITASSTGTLPSTSFKVVTGTVGNGTCGTSATNYSGCIIEIANATESDRADSNIDFVAPAVTAVPAPVATRVTASGVPGATVAAAITGRNFTAVAKITGGAGSTISVTGVSKTVLRVKIKESASAKAGSGTLVIRFKDGKSARVKYTVK